MHWRRVLHLNSVMQIVGLSSWVRLGRSSLKESQVSAVARASTPAGSGTVPVPGRNLKAAKRCQNSRPGRLRYTVQKAYSKGARAGMICLLVVAGLGSSAQAGEKLVITGQKTLVGPGLNKMAIKRSQLNGSPQLKEAPMPFDHFSVQPQVPRWRAKAEMTKEEKREAMQRAEKENWALLAPGQLQEEQGSEFDFGVREYRGYEAEENVENRDYTFYGAGKNRAESPDKTAQPRSRSAQGRSVADHEGVERARRDLEQREEDGRSSEYINPFRVSQQNPTGTSLGAGLTTDVRLQGGLNPAVSANAVRSGNAGYAGGNLLGANSGLAQANQGQEKRMESFRSLLGANNGSSSLLNQSPDLTRQSLNPAIGSSSWAGPNDSFNSPANNHFFDQRINQQPSFGSPRASGFSSLPALDFRQPQPKSNPLLEPSPSFDAMRPKF